MDQNSDKYFYRLFTEAFPNEPSEEARQKRILNWMKKDLPGPVASNAEQTLMETIGNPDLLLTNDIRVYREHVRNTGQSFDRPDLPKCSARAVKHRSDGNLLYAKKEYGNAIERYNESICCAPNESEDLAIGYANRSAVYCTTGNHMLALANIALAKKYHYPERLMPKLLAREATCKQAIGEDNLKAISAVPSGPDWKPFVSQGIRVRKLPVYNNSMVAKRNFEAGDVVLQERPLMVAFNDRHMFATCNHCRSGNLLHLIPCPSCVSAMYCNEKCLRDGQRVHRFECGISGELGKLGDACIGGRMFFHGLALFDGDINKMMEFCRTVKASEDTFLDMDYANYDALREFEIFLAVKPKGIPWPPEILLNVAKAHAMLSNVPSVQALITNSEQDDFMLQCFNEYMQKAVTMSIKRTPFTGFVTALYPVASLCNHSCDPNTLALDYGGQLKLIAFRPIRRGEQILISYGPSLNQDASARKLAYGALGYKCICDVCDVRKHQQWLAQAKQAIHYDLEDWETVAELMTDAAEASTGTDLVDGIKSADMKKALQRFVQRYASIYPRGRDEYGTVLEMYCFHLEVAHWAEMDAGMRAKIAG